MSTSNEVQLIKSAPHAATTAKFLLIHNVHEILREELTNAYDDSWLDTICMSLVCTRQRFRFSTTKLCTIQSNKRHFVARTNHWNFERNCRFVSIESSDLHFNQFANLLSIFFSFLLSLRLNRYFSFRVFDEHEQTLHFITIIDHFYNVAFAIIRAKP